MNNAVYFVAWIFVVLFVLILFRFLLILQKITAKRPSAQSVAIASTD